MGECEARRLASQEFHCTRCKLRWDADDPEPPTCGKLAEVLGVDHASGPDRTVVQKVTRASLTERLTALCERLRGEAGALELPRRLSGLCDELEDMIVEVGVMESTYRATTRITQSGPLPPNVVPLGR